MSPCDDCEYDTTPWVPGKPWEYYMVHEDVWPADCEFLCLTCLENRLGRALTVSDFTDAPLNDLDQFPSVAIGDQVVDLLGVLDPNAKAFQHRTVKLHNLLSHVL